MKKIYIYIIIGLLAFTACDDDAGKRFEPFDEKSIQFTIQEEYPEWYNLLEATGMAPTFNLGSTPLTCFVTKDSALLDYVNGRGYNSVQAWVAEEPDFAKFFIRYHTVLNTAYELSMFREGKMRDTTASGDFLVCRFQSSVDEGGIYINHNSKIVRQDIEAVNGYIHELGRVIDPVTDMLYDFFNNNDRYSIFAQAVQATETQEYFTQMEAPTLKIRSRRTLFVTPDEVYNQNGIYSLDDLKARYSPDNTDYTNPENPLNRYVLFHLLEGDYSTAEFAQIYDIEDEVYYVSRTNGYTLGTYAENTAMLIQAIGVDYIFNKQARFNGSTFNVQLRNGFAHEIDGLLEIIEHENILTTIETTEGFGFTKVQEYRNKSIERFKEVLDKDELAPWMTWKSTPSSKPNAVMYSCFTKGSYNYYWSAWARKMMYGDCIIADLGPAGELSLFTRPIPKGKYKIEVIAQRVKQTGGIFQLYIDDKRVGGNISLYDSGWDEVPSYTVSSAYEFDETKGHTITMKAVKSGVLTWDCIIFTPIN